MSELLCLLAGAALAVHLSAAAQEAPPPASDETITVMAEKLRRLKLVTRTDSRTGVTRCVLKRSSGDAAFDAKICEVVLACAESVTTKDAMETCVARSVAAYTGVPPPTE